MFDSNEKVLSFKSYGNFDFVRRVITADPNIISFDRRWRDLFKGKNIVSLEKFEAFLKSLMPQMKNSKVTVYIDDRALQ